MTGEPSASPVTGEPSELPVIGVPLRPWNRAGKPRRLMQDRSYLDVVAEVGGVPLPLPITPERPLRQLFGLCDGLLLPGGRDVDPATYGAVPPPGRSLDTHPELDPVEVQLVAWAAGAGLPLLGICRGAQLLNVALGGSLWIDLVSDEQSPPGVHAAEPGALTGHPLTISAPSWLHDAIGATETHINSRHHQAVRVLGRDVRAVAWAPDAVVEAIEVRDDRWFAAGVQWHPEELPADHPAGPALVRSLVAAARRYRSARAQPAETTRIRV